MATATAVATGLEKPVSILDKLTYPVALVASLSIWFLAIRAPLWLDETLAYWQVSGGFDDAGEAVFGPGDDASARLDALAGGCTAERVDQLLVLGYPPEHRAVGGCGGGGGCR